MILIDYGWPSRLKVNNFLMEFNSTIFAKNTYTKNSYHSQDYSFELLNFHNHLIKSTKA